MGKYTDLFRKGAAVQCIHRMPARGCAVCGGVGGTSEGFSLVYDIEDSDALRQADQHRRLWGCLYTSAEYLDDRHIVLNFRPAPDPRWRRWEAVRRRWILEDEGAVPSGPGQQ